MSKTDTNWLELSIPKERSIIQALRDRGESLPHIDGSKVCTVGAKLYKVVSEHCTLSVLEAE